MLAGVLGTARGGGRLPWTLDSLPYSSHQHGLRLQKPSAGRGVGERLWVGAACSGPVPLLLGGLHKPLGLSVVLPSHRSQQVLTVAALSLSKCGHLAS